MAEAAEMRENATPNNSTCRYYVVRRVRQLAAGASSHMTTSIMASTDPNIDGETGNVPAMSGDVHSHSFHLNLPSHCIGPDDVPYVTRYAEKKSRAVLRLARSIVLTDSAFVDTSSGRGDGSAEGSEQNDMEVDNEEVDEDDDDDKPPTMLQVIKMCNRLNTQLSGLESLKHCGLNQLELCEILLRTLTLLSASVTVVDYDKSGDDDDDNLHKIHIRFDDTGMVLGKDADELRQRLEDSFPASTGDEMNANDDPVELEQRLTEPFALPSPARQALLSVATTILSKKGPLMSVSNASLFVDKADGSLPHSRHTLVIKWKALLRILLRTAPYLDEHKAGLPPEDSSSRQSTTLRRTVEVIRSSRRFFDQGISPNSNIINDATAQSVWDMVKTDVMYHTHSNSFLRGVILLYLFSPSRCTSQFYEKALPVWLDCWDSVDRCPELDYLFLTMFCRGRKHVEHYDWGQLRRRLLTQCGYWLQIPVGGSSSDNSFPNAAPPRMRGVPTRLKAFVGSGGSYQEGIDFVRKVSKLLVFCVGRRESNSDSNPNGRSSGTEDLLRFLAFVTPYFNPSNSGPWTYPLGVLLHYLSYDFCRRIGMAASVKSLEASHPDIARKLKEKEPFTRNLEVPPNELASILDSMTPLCQQALYSKSSHVSSAAESAMLYLAQIDPVRVCPPFLDLATRALDISSITMSHQAPAALSALNRLVQPSLRRQPSVLLSRLPEILRLSLAGIDSNDQNKSIRTLIFYRNFASWFPIGIACKHGPRKVDEHLQDGTLRVGKDLMSTLSTFCENSEYEKCIASLPEGSLLNPHDFDDVSCGDTDVTMLLEETASATSDWALAFLDRIYMFLQAAGEREKVSRSSHGVASRHSSADASQTKNFTRVLRECLVQTFAAMDDATYNSSVRSVARFLTDETLYFAAKDAASLCQAVASARSTMSTSEESRVLSPGLDALVPILSSCLSSHSNKTVIYRLRCLAGAVKQAGKGVLNHRGAIVHAIQYALSNKDRHVYKTGCKLLRHTLASQCEAYPLSTDSAPRIYDEDGNLSIGRSAQLRGDRLEWHVPEAEQIDFAVELLELFVVGNIHVLGSKKGDQLDTLEWRRVLRVVRYSLRGCSGILLDAEDLVGTATMMTRKGARRPSTVVDEDDEHEAGPNEKSAITLVSSSSKSSQATLLNLRKDLSLLMGSMLSLIASETSDEDASSDILRNQKVSFSSDVKICKEIIAISLLLLTRRSAPFRSIEQLSICSAQKELITDYALTDQADLRLATLKRAGLLGGDGRMYYKDGEDGGKTVPRRLLTTRVNLFHQAIQRDASYAVPRRLRKMRSSTNVLFSLDVSMDDVLERCEAICDASQDDVSPSPMSLDAYECIIDGLCAASCLSNATVRNVAVGSVDYALTRYAWAGRYRVSRLLAAISLEDDDVKGKFGIASCSQLSKQTDANGKRKRFAEVLKGTCSIIALSRVMKEILASERHRFVLGKSLCATQGLISRLPPEEMQKMVHYFQSIFSSFRSKYFRLPRITEKDHALHESYLLFLLENLSTDASIGLSHEDMNSAIDTNGTSDDKNIEEEKKETNNVSNVNWRNRLTSGWMITSSTDARDLIDDDPRISSRLWMTCFDLIDTEIGQPLQRVALGLLGRLITLSLLKRDFLHLPSDTTEKIEKQQPDVQSLSEKLIDEKFCISFGNALVYDHRPDSSIGGGHHAQWSAGVEDIIRDAAANVAPKTLFPFQRTSRSSATFKVNHAQLVQAAMLAIGRTNALESARHLLTFAKEIASAPPSEDQKNQICTSAEIFSGVCRSLLQCSSKADDASHQWVSMLLPFLSDVIPKIPISHIGAFYDSIRYGIHHFLPNTFYELTEWLVAKIEDTLWQSTDDADDGQSAEGFTAQSKWLVLLSAILIELDDETDLGSLNQLPWYTSSLTDVRSSKVAKNSDTLTPDLPDDDLRKSWKAISSRLLPRLLLAIGHPYEKCRDHIASCLFRICYCHRKFSNTMTAKGLTTAAPDDEASINDPGEAIIKKLSSIISSEATSSFRVQRHALITARKFMVYCVHLGDCKNEFSPFIIPLLPLIFEGLRVTLSDEAGSVDPADRMLEAEVVKGFRYQVAEISSSCQITYGNEEDITRVLDAIEIVSRHDTWQVRQATANFLRCFQGGHKFVFTSVQTQRTTKVVTALLADERREVSAAAMAALTGILAAMPLSAVKEMVEKQILVANKAVVKKKKKKKQPPTATVDGISTKIEVASAEAVEKERKRAQRQQTSVSFLCSAILARPYDTPKYVPEALEAISKHSFESRAPLAIRETVKMCCAEFKKTHMSDNWEEHKKKFTQEQLEALNDVVSTPHYYA